MPIRIRTNSSQMIDVEIALRSVHDMKRLRNFARYKMVLYFDKTLLKKIIELLELN